LLRQIKHLLGHFIQLSIYSDKKNPMSQTQKLFLSKIKFYLHTIQTPKLSQIRQFLDRQSISIKIIIKYKNNKFN
jgi:hypothetical protein